ncbi:hypothetical protein JCM3770_000679 [Rhodotorula araucariae]
MSGRGAWVRAGRVLSAVGAQAALWALSILAPLSYIAFLVGSLWLFSKIYRRRQANKPAAEPWFPPHKSRDIYVSLLSLDPPPPRPVLVAALLRRAMDDVKLIWSIRDAKTSLTTLLGKGQIGDDLWERFLQAEQELEAEIVEVVGEANTFEPGYGQKIFNIASDMVSHERWKEVYRDIKKRRDEENARLASSSPPAAVLAPTPYLSPSSLTLSPSNPLPAAGITPAPTAGAALLAPLGAGGPNDVTSQPPSRGGTPAVEGAVAPVSPAKGASTPPRQVEDDDKAVLEAESAPDPDEAPLAPVGVPAAPPTPASPPKTAQPPQPQRKAPQGKKGKKKPNVKGGR